MLDFVVVGAGLTGATIARRLTDRGQRGVVLEARSHIAGNCYTQQRDGFTVHEYGPHSFHTNDDGVWQWVQRFADWDPFTLRVKALVRGRGFVPLPINLMTLNQFWGVSSPGHAREVLDRNAVDAVGDNAEAHLLRTIGYELYRTLFEGYTGKQWGMDPRDLPRSIVARLPVRLNFDDRYHTSKYRALPRGGYTTFVDKMLDGIPVELETPFSFSDRNVARQIIYTGAPDKLYNQDMGALPYRSLRFEHELLDVDDFQGGPVINYPGREVAFTRIVEHKHFHGGPAGRTLITREYPGWSGDPYYPIPTQDNIALAKKYRQRAEKDGIVCAGRLGTYRYLDMDGAIAAALQLANRL
jgi:UDP-galactopyranose mutase